MLISEHVVGPNSRPTVGQAQVSAANTGKAEKTHASIAQELLSVNYLSANICLLLGSLVFSAEKLHV